MATWIVTTNADDGSVDTNPDSPTYRTGSLRGCIGAAASGDTIVFDNTGENPPFPDGIETTISLSSSLQKSGKLTIDGGETWTVAYVVRNGERVFIDENNPAQEGEVVKTLLKTRVILDAQNLYRCLYNNNGQKNLIGLTFKNGKFNSSGGCVYVENNGTGGVNGFLNCVFSSDYNGNIALNGGGVYAVGRSYNNLVNCFFDGLKVSNNGAGFYSNLTSQNNLTNCVFVNCTSNVNGAAYFTDQSKNTLTNCTFDNCSCGRYGGGSYATFSSENSYIDCTFDSCHADNEGGGVHAISASLNTLSGCVFTNCSAVNRGGGLKASSVSINTLVDCTFNNCFVSANTSNGGAIAADSTSELSLTNCNINSCSASSSGGGIFIDSCAKVTFSVSSDSQKTKVIDCSATSGSGISFNGFYQNDITNVILTNSDVYRAYDASLQETVYFTTNFNSGSGSLRSVIASATEFSIIEPDPTVFNIGETIEISLDSSLGLTKKLIFRGSNFRVRLNGQGNITPISATSSQIFENFDFINGYSSTSNGASIAINASIGFQLIRCRIAGSEGIFIFSSNQINKYVGVHFLSCEIVGNKCSNNFFYYTAPLLKGSTFSGNYKDTNRTDYLLQPRVIDSLINATTYVTPPSTLSDGEWTSDFWKNYDFRLPVGSSYLTGAEQLTNDSYTETDFLGHPRKTNGALGAYEGAWLVVNNEETLDVEESLTVDYADISDGASIKFDGVDRILAVTNAATIGSATLTATENSNGFLAVPVNTNISSATFTGVVACNYGADVISATAQNSGVSWTAENLSTPVLIEKQTGATWTTLTAAAVGGSYSTSLSRGDVVRIFDGVRFLTATAKDFVHNGFYVINDWADQEWNITSWVEAESSGGDGRDDACAFTVDAWAIDPELYD